MVYVWFLLHTKEIAGLTLFTESDFGVFTMLSFILALSSTAGILALRSASVKYIAQYIAEGKEEEAKSIFGRVLQVSLVTSTIIVLVLFGVAGVLSSLLSRSILVFALLPLASALTIFYAQGQGLLQALQKMRTLAMIALMYTVVHYSVAIVLVYLGLGVLGIAASWVVALTLACLATFMVGFRSFGFPTRVHKLKPLLKFSSPIYVAMLLSFVVGWIDQIFVFPFLGIAALGVYNLAVRASIVPRLIANAIATSIFPKLSELHSTFGVESLKSAFKRSTRYAALLGFPLSLLVATLAYPVIVLFATVRFLDAVAPLAVMCIASLPTIVGSAILPTLYTLERTRVASITLVVSIFLEALFAYLSLVYFNAGLTGVALSRVFGALAQFILGAYVLWLTLKIEFDKEAIWKSAVASIIMVVSIFALELLRAAIEPRSYQLLILRMRQLPIYALVGLVVYALSILGLKAVKREDIDLLHAYLPQRLRWIALLVDRIVRAGHDSSATQVSSE